MRVSRKYSRRQKSLHITIAICVQSIFCHGVIYRYFYIFIYFYHNSYYFRSGLLNIVAYEKRFLCNDFATTQRKRVIKRSLKHQKTDRSQTNRRNIIRCSSECRIYRSRSNGWRGCDSNPLSLGLTLPPRAALVLFFPSNTPFTST